MKIIDILKMPIGQKLGGFVLTIKIAKKKWQVGKVWMHQVVLMDETGEMLADVRIGGYLPLIAGNKIRIIVAEIQAVELPPKTKFHNRTKLYIDQFEKLTITVPEYEAQMGNVEDDWDKVNRGKVRHGLCCAFIRSNTANPLNIKEQIEELVEYIMTGR